MRRKSTRNAQKATPDKPAKEVETPPKTRRSRRRKRTPSKSSDSEEEVLAVPRSEAPAPTPDTTTKSHTPTDEETLEEPVWKVTSTEDAPKGEIQKLKICLTRPSPDSPDKTKSRRSKSNSQTEDETTSSEDKSSSRRTRSQGSPNIRTDVSSQEGDEDLDEKKGKGKSKGKHKSKIEKSPHLSEPELQTNNEISENAQVTPQSPSIDKPVDNENDHKVADNDLQNVTESVPERDNVEETVCNDSGNVQDKPDDPESKNEVQDVCQSKMSEDDDDEPLSVIQKIAHEKTVENPETVIEHQIVESSNDQQEKVEIPHEETVEQTETHEQNAEKHEDKDSTVQPPETNNTVQPEDKNSAVQSEDKDSVVQSEDKINEEVIPEVESQESIEESTTKPATENSDEKHAEEPEIQHTSNDSPKTVLEPSTEEKIGEDKAVEVEEIEQAETSPQKIETNTTEENTSAVVSEEKEKPDESVSEEKEKSDENVSAIAPEEKKSIKERAPRRRLKRTNECLTSAAEEKEEQSEPRQFKPSRIKRKWTCDSKVAPTLIKVDLESIQSVWPTIDFPEEPDLHLEAEKERRKSITDSSARKLERKVSVEYKSDFSERPSFEKQTSVGSTTNDSEDNSNIIAFNRKISIVDDTASKLKPPPSPAKNPIANILYITNLVRPFTVKQLKELLERTGKIQEDGFWTDRIKSKCYVQYESQEEAEATRNALHGVQWPIGNGKKLVIDYAAEEDMQNAKNPPAPPPAAPVVEPKVAVKENLEPVENKPRAEEKPLKELEKKKPEGPVREWDIGKKDVRRERSRSRERSRKHRRSPSPPDDFITRKQRKLEESVPQKLMDDLFLKTKATPSIYWQPLSPEEISMKQQQRLVRMEEHKRRMEENSRMKGRDMGRGAFRRRYD